jgi:hypothetical protein
LKASVSEPVAEEPPDFRQVESTDLCSICAAVIEERVAVLDHLEEDRQVLLRQLGR